MSILLSFGQKVTDKAEKLEAILPAELHEKLCADKPLQELTARLRQVMRMSMDAYRRQKTLLPYFSCAQFKPPQRHSKNLVETQGLVLDIDKLGDKISAFRQKIEQDERVLLSFVSPSGKGLKVLFAFSTPIRDTALYAGFYKRFAVSFAKQYQLEEFVDLKTCDAVRACFLAHDPNAYYNPLAVPLEPPSEPMKLSALSENLPGQLVEEDPKLSEEERDALDKKTYKEIIDRLNGKKGQTSPREKQPPYVPPILAAAVEKLGEAWKKYEISVEEVIDIQYGKKFVLCRGVHRAEINVYFGKKGFSVVATPKTGTHPELTELCKKLAELALFE